MRTPGIFSTTTYGPFYRSGPYTRFLRRALTIPASWTATGVGLQTVEPVMVRAPHVGPAFQALTFVPIITVALAGLIAAIAMVWEYIGRHQGMGRGPALLDILWQSLVTFALMSYLSMGIYSLATTQHSTLERLVLASNKHPFQDHSSYFVLLTIVVFPEALRFIFLIVTTFIMVAIPIAETTAPLEPKSFSGAILVLGFNLIYITAASWLLRKSMALDDAERNLDLEKITSRTQRAKNNARQRINSFIHDHIISVLISVASGLSHQRILAVTARQTLVMLDQRVSDQSSTSSSQLFEHIGKIAHELSPCIIIREDSPESVALPPGVGTVLFDATHEALTNSFRHAATADHPDPSIVLCLSTTNKGVEIVVNDNGAGFNLETVDSARLGIRHSILERMQSIGGNALLISSPGQGTRVVLTHPLTMLTKDPLIPGVPSPMDIEDVIKQWPARVVIGYFIFANLYSLLVYWGIYQNPWISAVAFLALATIALLLLMPWWESMLPAPFAYLIPVLGGVANFAVLSQLISNGWPEAETWSIGFLVVLCWGLALYQRIGAAFLGIAMIVASFALWVIGSNLPLVLIVRFSLIHVIAIVAWIVVIFLARWASVRIISDERQRMELEAERIENERAAAVVESMLDTLDRQVRPILEGVVAGEPITAETRHQAELLEAELRDEIRGGYHLSSLAKEAVREARERGVAVVLMDDRGDDDLPEAGERALQKCANNILRTTSSDRVVIRLAPAGRATFATINTSDELVSISEDGSVTSS